ncbi:CdaR family protein [Bacillus nakamurai]|uniref:YbbR-like domain-containing protein YbbR n=1 Tax=Bacillus nakamurai TaxID=1793963 RepID=A0A150F8E3_9BACI|nr:YbbR-like domain-containing protein [Bacillus nakamurai]KXZ21049.1 YbbR-like domain-containing protein YbbR [Bacillus nakamurai]MCP6683801.1 YbbR-like domain-containing protein [Bacillus nakamurai]MED1228132.1 YbbR-like domain-containing protein [Bacillus nakamurai]
MDKFLNNRWAVKIIALLFALLLYVAVNNNQAPTPKKPGESFFPTSTTDEATLTDIPVKAYYDEANYVVTGVPQTVNVTIKGSTSAVKKARQTKNFEIYADMNNLKTGTHKVELKAKNLSDGLTISINPSVTTVTIQEKTAVSFPVEVEYYNKSKMKTGYTPQQPIISPKNVQITGSKNVIDNISLVKASVNLENAAETIEKEVKVTVYDKDGNTLPVDVEPSVIKVTVPVASPSKKLPFKIEREGSLPDGVSVASIDSSPSEVTVYGPQDVLNSLEFIDGVALDLSKIDKDTDVDADIPLPKGVTKVSPEKITLHVKVDSEDKQDFDDVAIKTVGLGSSQQIEFLDPKSQTITVTAKGSPANIKALKKSDIELYANVSDLNDGEHSVKLEVNGPQNITWSLSKKTAKIKLTSKKSLNSNNNDGGSANSGHQNGGSGDTNDKDKNQEDDTDSDNNKSQNQNQNQDQDQNEDGSNADSSSTE